VTILERVFLKEFMSLEDDTLIQLFIIYDLRFKRSKAKMQRISGRSLKGDMMGSMPRWPRLYLGLNMILHISLLR